jgi:hypothetical protein
MRDCRVAAAVLTIAVCGMAGSALFETDWQPAFDKTLSAMVSGGCWLAASVLLLFSFLLFARHVIMDVQGLVVAKPKQDKDGAVKDKNSAKTGGTSTTTSDDEAKTSRRIDAAHDGPAAPKGRSDLEPDMPPTKRSTRLREVAEYEQQRYEEDDEPRMRKQKKRRVRPRDTERDDYDDCEGASGQPSKLSKSERKRLRKIKAQQRRAA